MNDVWKKIFKDYVDSYKAIETLKKNDVIDEEVMYAMECDLLMDIIITMKSEIEN